MKELWEKLPDWAKRAVKTFVETFLTFVVMSVSALVSKGWPESWSAWKVAVVSILGGALSAAITAAWNIILERFKK